MAGVTRLEFSGSLGYPDGHEIRLEITVRGVDGQTLAVEAVLDTGASASIFNVAVLRRVGVADISTGESATIHLVDGRSIHGFVHLLELQVAGVNVRAPAFFSEALPEDMDNLLGLIGVLDQIDIAIIHRERTLYVRSSG